ncbi:MAG: putative damage-inducible protein DinB [Alteromonadaceae bacterium]|jgi:uncharacterized damage-inducible protein DinB
MQGGRAMNQLLKGCAEALAQIGVIIDATIEKQTATGQNIYQVSRLGSHVRHVVDHFLALQKGLTTQVIDYNQRNRDSIIQTDINAGAQAIEGIIEQLSQMPSTDFKVSVICEIDCSVTLSEQFDSTLRRELLYLINHTIHHTAYVKLLVKPYGVTLADPIGIAPGTATFLRSEQTA